MMNIAILSDLHFTKHVSSAIPERQGTLSDILLLRTVRRLNRYVKPDLTILAGDLLEDPHDVELLTELAAILKQLDSPVLVIPGNHDPAAELFYQYLPKPEEHLDLHGFRFVTFLDRETAGYCSVRSKEEIQRLAAHCQKFPGRVISIQHTPVFENAAAPSPFHADNAQEIFSAAKPLLMISGHYHPGFEPVLSKNGTFSCAVPALCESPFRYAILELDEDNGSIHYRVEQHALPHGICDTHIHTRNAYCQENLDIQRTFDFVNAFNLKQFAFTEHSGQLYVSASDYWSGNLDRGGFSHTPAISRAKDYFALLDEFASHHFVRGFELDISRDLKLLVDPEDLKKVDFKIGAVHFISAPPTDLEAVKEEFMSRNRALCQSQIHVLAHPFRIFQRMKIDTPRELFLPCAKLLKQYGVAAEINFHTNQPEPEFFSICHDLGVPITLGSDTHNLFEIGEFYAHLKLLKAIGISLPELYQLS